MLDESLLNTKSGALMLLSDEFKPYRTYKEKGTVELFSSPEDGKQKIIAFQREQLGEVLSKPNPEKNDGLGLYTALHYTNEWLHPFSKMDTCPRPFYLEDGQEIQPETMSNEISTAYGKITTNYEVAALPGKNQSIIYFVKPRLSNEEILQRLWNITGFTSKKAQEETLQRLGHTFDFTPKNTKENVLQHLWDICNHDDELHHTIILQMPKILIESSVLLTPILDLLNMPYLAKEQFTVDTILNPIARTRIANIQHDLQLCIDEKGAEVKAFTSIFMPIFVGISDPPKPLLTKMDSPYFIVIKENAGRNDTHRLHGMDQ